MSEDTYKRIMEGQLPEIVEGVEVRPLLKTEDLRLIRKGFVALIRSGIDCNLLDFTDRDDARARDLLKRMLRKVK